MPNPHSLNSLRVFTKIALEGARVVLCTPDWGKTGDPCL